MQTRYINTDLDLAAHIDLRPLLTALAAAGVEALHGAVRGDDDAWHAVLETAIHYPEPETTIAAMLTAIEALAPAERSTWNACHQRDFNLGYDCGTAPWAFAAGLSNGLLARIAAVGATVQWTLYPYREEDDAPQP